jgi:predicted enzyme related to lactoylglutathione lyase
VTGQPVVRVEVMGEDAAKLQSFYSDLFGWKITDHRGYGIVDDAPIGTGIGAAPGVADRVTFYVEVPDVEDALAEAERLGGKRVMGPQKVARRVELGLFEDPEGHVIGLIRAA